MKTIQNSSWEKARAIVLQYGWNTMAYQILNPGMSLWFSKHHDGVIGFVQTSSHYVVAGSPISKEEYLPEITTEFFRSAVANKKQVCFFGAQERISNILSEFTPTSTILLGAQPTWSPKEWLSNVSSKQSLRAQILRVQNKHVSAKIIKGGVDQIKEDLQRCLKEWILSRHLPAMHFLVEPNTLELLDDRILCVAEKDSHVIGFCIASPIPLRKGWLIEQIVRTPTAPNGSAELMLQTMIEEIYKRDSNFITLGLSPLSQYYPTPLDYPIWLRLLLRSVRSYGKIFYNFNGLDQFKAKFLPSTWEPVYAITNEPKPTLSTLYSIATAFSLISPVNFVAKGLAKYGRQIIQQW